MKKLLIVLPLAVLLAYCSSSDDTQTTVYDETTTASTADNTTTEVDVTSDATTTTSTGNVTTSTDVSDVNTNTSTVTVQDNHDVITASATLPRPDLTGDPNDPMYQHFLRTNGEHWTWDMDYEPNRPLAGTYDATASGNYQLIMTPELANAWKLDRSMDLWRSSTAYSTNNASYNNRQLLFGDTYISASESFDDTEGKVEGTITTDKSTSATHGLNNNASANSTTANQMNGNTTVDVNADPSISVNGNASVNATTPATGTTMNATTGTTDAQLGVSYTAANGNAYGLPRLNLYLDNGSFTGYTGCNNISGRIEVSGNKIKFLNTSPSTNIDCMGGLDQAIYLEMLKNIDSYAYVNNELHLLRGNEVVLRFKKNAEGSDVSVR